MHLAPAICGSLTAAHAAQQHAYGFHCHAWQMEEEFVRTQELLKPHEERTEEDRSKVSCKL